VRQRQFGAERVQLAEVELERLASIAGASPLQHVGGDEGVAVAVAADPAADAEEGRQLPVCAGEGAASWSSLAAVEARQFGEEGVVVDS
jgi:hypothetical protein